MVKVLKSYLLKIDRDLKENEFIYLLRLISPDKRSRILQYRDFKDAQQSILAEILIRKYIKMYLGLSNDEIIFIKNIYGKPSLLNQNDFHFNISHSDKYIICIIDKAPVGIDIEMVKSVNLKIAKRFFSHNEFQYIINRTDNERLIAFYDIWTMKEAYAKYIGKGLSIYFKSFNVLEPMKNIFLHQILRTEHVICHAYTSSCKKMSVNILNVNELLNGFQEIRPERVQAKNLKT